MNEQPQIVKACANCGREIARFERAATKLLSAEFHELLPTPVRTLDEIGEVCKTCHVGHTA